MYYVYKSKTFLIKTLFNTIYLYTYIPLHIYNCVYVILYTQYISYYREYNNIYLIKKLLKNGDINQN
jgi:hypothetical protein